MQFPFQLDPAKEFDCVGFGTNAVDYLIRVPHYPAFNSKVELSGYTLAPGGEIATTMVGLRRLGLKTVYVGRFGDDDLGEIGRRSLADEGVDISFAETMKDTRTQIQKKGFELRDRTTEMVEDAISQVQSSRDKLTMSGREKLQELKHQGQELVVEQLDHVAEAAQAGKKAIKGS